MAVSGMWGIHCQKAYCVNKWVRWNYTRLPLHHKCFQKHQIRSSHQQICPFSLPHRLASLCHSFSKVLLMRTNPRAESKEKICCHWKLIKTLDLRPCCQKPRLEPEEIVLMFSHETHAVVSSACLHVNLLRLMRVDDIFTYSQEHNQVLI